MTAPAERRAKSRPSPASRRSGYAIAIGVNAVLVYLVYVRPTWREFGFLTEDASAVIPWFVVALLVGIGVNVARLVYDPLWFHAVGEVVSAVFAVVVLNLAVTVFPFDVAPDSTWAMVLRVGLVVSLVVAAIAVIVNVVLVVVRLVQGEPPTAATSGSDAG